MDPIRSSQHLVVWSIISTLVFTDLPSYAYSIKTLTSRQVSANTYRSTVVMPMKDDGDTWDEKIEFVIYCNSVKITRGDGITPATGTFPRVFLDEVIRRTCRK